MEGLPKLPGLQIEDHTKQNHHLAHSLKIRNGYRVADEPVCGIGRDAIFRDQAVQFISKANDPLLYDPILTYGCIRKPQIPPFCPHFVQYDKMILTFRGYFRQEVAELPEDANRIRYVNILYFLEDNTITVLEPQIQVRQKSTSNSYCSLFFLKKIWNTYLWDRKPRRKNFHIIKTWKSVPALWNARTHEIQLSVNYLFTQFFIHKSLLSFYFLYAFLISTNQLKSRPFKVIWICPSKIRFRAFFGHRCLGTKCSHGLSPKYIRK